MAHRHLWSLLLPDHPVQTRQCITQSAQLEKIPYMLIIGDKEMQDGTVAVRSRKAGDLGAMPVDAFVADAVLEVAEQRK